MKQFLLPFSLSMLVISGCAVQSQQPNCRRLNWHYAGQLDGTQGIKRQHLAALFPNCGANIVIDHAAYQQGWQQGLLQYCQPSNAAVMGLEAKPDNSSFCPSHMRAAFLHAYRVGSRHYVELSPSRTALSHATAELDKTNQELVKAIAKNAALKNATGEHVFSPQRQYQMQKAKINIKRLSNKIQYLKRQQAELSAHYEKLKEKIVQAAIK